MNVSGRLLRHIASTETVLARDLFLFNPQVNSGEKISYVGRKPSLYPRTVTDYKPERAQNGYHERNTSIFETLEHYLSFRKHLEMRTSHIEKFLGPDFQLSFQDLLCILCGVSELSVDLGKEQATVTNPVFTDLLVEHDRVRDMGERFYNLHSVCATVFADLQHLSASHVELQHSLSCLDDRKQIITDFMKKNGLYNCIIPYRGPTAGKPLDPQEFVALKQQIRQSTCIASFFTLLGITNARYGSLKVLRELWYPKIMGSDTGILKIVTDMLTGSSAS